MPRLPEISRRRTEEEEEEHPRSSQTTETKIEMATRKKSGQRPPKSLGRTIEKSTNSSVIEEKLFERVEEEDDGPLVFVCEKCKLIVGDSMSWDNEDNQKHIGLKREWVLLFCY